MVLSKCLISGKEVFCDVSIGRDGITILNEKGRLIRSIHPDEITFVEQRGNTLTVLLTSGETYTITITKGLFNQVMYFITLLEINSSPETTLGKLFASTDHLSKCVARLESVLLMLRKGSIPAWGRLLDYVEEMESVVRSEEAPPELLPEVEEALKELKENIRSRYVEGIKLSTRKTVRVLTRIYGESLTRIIRSANLSPLVDIVILTHAYSLAKRLGLENKASTIKLAFTDTLKEFLSNSLWLDESSVNTAVEDASKTLEKEQDPTVLSRSIVEGVVKVICRAYAIDARACKAV